MQKFVSNFLAASPWESGCCPLRSIPCNCVESASCSIKSNILLKLHSFQRNLTNYAK
jgi:hypothetical protein